MSVDKFGRSSASIARHRRPLALPPSRRQLLSLGALCRTDDFVDFKDALARNIAPPVLPSDAACKEYVDDSVGQVQLSMQKSVQESIVTIVQQTHALTVQYLDQQVRSLRDELVQLKTAVKHAEFNASSGEQRAVREIHDIQQHVDEIHDEMTKMLERVIVLENELDQHVEKSAETVSDIRIRIGKLDTSSMPAPPPPPRPPSPPSLIPHAPEADDSPEEPLIWSFDDGTTSPTWTEGDK